MAESKFQRNRPITDDVGQTAATTDEKLKYVFDNGCDDDNDDNDVDGSLVSILNCSFEMDIDGVALVSASKTSQRMRMRMKTRDILFSQP